MRTPPPQDPQGCPPADDEDLPDAAPGLQNPDDLLDQGDIQAFRQAFLVSLADADAAARADAAFQRLYTRWWGRTVDAARRIVQDHGLAEEAAQEAWIRLYKALQPGGNFDNSLPFAPFCLRVVFRQALSVRAQRQREAGHVRSVHAQQWHNPSTGGDPGEHPPEQALYACLAELRHELQVNISVAGLSEVFEELDTIPPVRNATLRDSVVVLIDQALPCVEPPQAKQRLSALRQRLMSGTPHPAGERLAVTALLKRTRMRLPDKKRPVDDWTDCPLYDWLEDLLEALLPQDKAWRSSWWAYLVAMQTLTFGEATAACALYRIHPANFNAGQNSRWHVRMQPLADCITQKTR